MNSAEKKIASTPRLGIIALVAAALTIVACSTRSNSAAPSPAPDNAKLRPAAMRTIEPSPAPPAAATPTGSKPSAYKQMNYRSRDYGVSFTYPWQYAYMSARMIADQDPVLHSKTDGTDGPFTLVRIEIPKGYYPDTNFDSGYFSVGIDQQLESEGCLASLGDEPVKTDTIHGAEFRWTESDVVGGGHSLKTRRYVTYANGTCYQLELGLTTSNEDGLAREVDPDKVFARLDSILRTVNIAGENSRSFEGVQTSSAAEPVVPQQ